MISNTVHRGRACLEAHTIQTFNPKLTERRYKGHNPLTSKSYDYKRKNKDKTTKKHKFHSNTDLIDKFQR